MGKIRNEWGDVPVFETLEPRLLLDGTSYIVNSLADVVADDGVVTLREAIEAANTNTAVTADVLPGSAIEVDIVTFDQTALQAEAGAGNPLAITLGGTHLEVADDLDIQGLGADVLTIDAAGASRVMLIDDGSAVTMKTVTLSGLTVTGGYIAGNGGGLNNSESLTLSEVTVEGNRAVYIDHCGGGGIFNTGDLRIIKSTVSDNSVDYGGGGIINYGTLHIAESTISNNRVVLNGSYAGGGLADNGESYIINSIFEGNTSLLDGGAILSRGSTLTVVNSVIVGNSASTGGGIHSTSGSVTLTNVTVSGNSADYGGGIYNTGTLTLNNTIVALNDATTFADIYGGVTSYGSLVGADPGFVRNPWAGADGDWGTPGDDYGDLRLQMGTSPAVGAGDNSLLPTDEFDIDGDGDTAEALPIDLAGDQRINYGIVDIGAYEGIFTPIVQEVSIVSYDPQQVVRVVLSESMDTGTFDPTEDVLSLIGAGAGHVLGHVWQDGRTLDLYCLLESYGDYTLILGPDIRSTDGEWMDADIDGICGEPGEDNSILAMTMTPPYVMGHTVAEGLPLNSVAVTFDRPMRAESFDAAEDVLSFDGPTGPLSLDSWRWLNEWTLELDMDLSTAGDYTLVLGSNILDRSGAALDNDGDLMPGEVGSDEYAIMFGITSPTVTGFIAPVLPPMDGVAIYFSREMDAASFSLADDLLDFTGPTGVVDVTGSAWLDSRTLRLETDDAGTGTYSFQLGGAVLDAWGNALDGDEDGVSGEPEDGYAASFTTMMHGTITEDTIIGGSNVVVPVDGDLRVPSGVTLTVLAGTIVKFSDASAGITVEGSATLVSTGTAEAPVMFTSYLDDSVGGDTNGDDIVTTPSYGNWRGVRIESNGQAELTHTEVRYANIAIDADSDYAVVNLSAVTLRENDLGIFVYRPYTQVTAENCLIVDNNREGVYVRASSAHIFRNCTIVGNGFGEAGHERGGIHVGAATVNLVNCIVAFNANGLNHTHADDSQTIIRDSVFYNPDGQDLVWTSGGAIPQLDQDGNMVADPLFVDPAAGNYRLDDGSPAIDAGLGFQAPSDDLSGNPRYDDPGMPNTGGGYPAYVDIGAFERQTATISGDLAVTNVSAPAPLFLSAGEAYSFDWTVANVGLDDIDADWQDVVYLSRNTRIDSGDTVLATYDRTGGLAAGESYTDTYDGTAPAEAGPWYLLVRANASGNVIEPNLADNVVASPTPLGVDIQTVEVGGAVAANVSAGQWEYLRLDATPGNTIVLSLAGGSGLKFYASRDIPPTLNDHDFAADAAGELRILNPADTTYYVGVYSPAGSHAFTVSAASTSLSIREVTPGVIGNVGRATLQILGDNFGPDTQAQLIAPDGTVIDTLVDPAQGILDHNESLRDSGKLYATFDLADAAADPGLYSVRLLDAGAQVVLPGAVSVVSGGQAALEAGLEFSNSSS